MRSVEGKVRSVRREGVQVRSVRREGVQVRSVRKEGEVSEKGR